MPDPVSLRVAAVLVVFFAWVQMAAAQMNGSPGLEGLVRANDRFGNELLQQVHAEAPDRNIVLAPLPLTILLGAIQTNSARDEARTELDHVFGWGKDPDISIPARMMLAAMDKPRVSLSAKTPDTGVVPRFGPESLWIENRLLFRSPKGKLPLLSRRFMESASRDFGLRLVNTGTDFPSESKLRHKREQTGRLPGVSPEDQVWLSSGMHIRQTWEELFMESTPQPGEFRTESGQVRTVQRVESELRKLPHVKNKEFEAVDLQCGRVTMTVVLPEPGISVRALEEFLAAHEDAIREMTASQYGYVTFPQFEIKATEHIENALRAMGVNDIFEHLDGVVRDETFRDPADFSKGMIPAAEAKVTDLAQAIDFGADKHGIHVDAESIIGAIPGGILMTQDKFHMFVNRPFVFLVRENTTGALLVIGALMDPADVGR